MWVAIYIFTTAKPPLHQFSKPMKKMRLKDQSMTASVHIGTECLVFVSSHFPKTREKYTNWDNLVCLSLDIFWGQSHLCLLLQTKVFCKSKHRWYCPQKMYKLRQTKLSWFKGTRGDKKEIFRTLVIIASLTFKKLYMIHRDKRS